MATAKKKSLSFACTEFLAEKKQLVGFHQYDGLKTRCPRFVSYCATLNITHVQDVTALHCHDWLKRLNVAPQTAVGYLGDLSNFLNWCTKVPRCWLPKNPTSDITRARKKRGMPIVLKPERVAELMAYVETDLPRYASFYALSVFAGIRADKRDGELKRLGEDVAANGWDPYLNDKIIRIARPKVGPPRQFPLKANLRAWLKSYPVLSTPTQWEHQCLIKKFSLPYNVLRHTAISAFVTDGGSMVEAAVFFGNSEGMIRNHYLNLMTDEDVAAFYKIMPTKEAMQQKD